MPVSGKLTVYIDESGTLPDPKDKISVVAAVGTDFNARIDLLMKRIKKRGVIRKNSGELKYYTAGDKTKIAFFKEIEKEDFIICTLTVDKMGRIIKDTPLNYSILCSLLIHDIEKISSDIGIIIIDRHFNNEKDVTMFNNYLYENIHKKIVLKHVDSLKEPRVNVADMIAGAVLANERGKDKKIYTMIEHKIIKKRRIKWTDAKKRILAIKKLG